MRFQFNYLNIVINPHTNGCTENKARGSLSHFYCDRAPKVNIHTPAGLASQTDHSLVRKLTIYTEPALLVCDEVGYLSLDQEIALALRCKDVSVRLDAYWRYFKPPILALF